MSERVEPGIGAGSSRGSASPLVVLVTGASAGIGRATASLLAEAGYRVYGTSRDGSAEPGGGYSMRQLELASDESVRRCVDGVLQEAGRIDVLFNNAGFGVVGAIEETAVAQAQAQMEVFLFGVHRMVRAVLPGMRAQNSGKIINMSSSASTVAVPFAGLYSAGKHAMAGYTEALRQEVSGFGVHASYIEATTVRTQASENVMVASERIEAYSPVRDRAITEFREAILSGMDPRTVASAVRRVIESESPRLVYRVDAKAKLLPVLKTVIPQRMLDAGFRRYGRSRGGVQRDR